MFSRQGEMRQRRFIVGRFERVVVDEPKDWRQKLVHALPVANLGRELAEDEEEVGQAVLHRRRAEVVDFGEAMAKDWVNLCSEELDSADSRAEDVLSDDFSELEVFEPRDPRILFFETERVVALDLNFG